MDYRFLHPPDIKTYTELREEPQVETVYTLAFADVALNFFFIGGADYTRILSDFTSTFDF